MTRYRVIFVCAGVFLGCGIYALTFLPESGVVIAARTTGLIACTAVTIAFLTSVLSRRF